MACPPRRALERTFDACTCLDYPSDACRSNCPTRSDCPGRSACPRLPRLFKLITVSHIRPHAVKMQRQHLGVELRPMKQNPAPREGNSCRLEGSGGRNENQEEMPRDSDVLEMVNFMLGLRKSPKAVTRPIFPSRRKKTGRKLKRKKLTLEDLEDLSDGDEEFKGPNIKKVRANMERRKSRRLEREKVKRDSGEYFVEEENENLLETETN